MRTAINYARQSDPANNPNFRRRWCEAAWLLRQEELLLGATRERPPRPPDKERPAPVVRTSNRPVVKAYFKTSASNYSRQADKAEARRAAEALFIARSR
jgi:hypothetical protein